LLLSEILTEQFERLLDRLSTSDPWPALAESGYLDLLRDQHEGGAGVSLEDLLPLALATGRRLNAPRIIETMAARMVDPDALDVGDLERVIGTRTLGAALAAAQMVGAMEQVQLMTLEYATIRQQFGRKIGKFQAVQHHITVLAEELLAARMAVQAAFVGPPLELSEHRAAAAKLRCGEAAEQVSAIAHAVHGALGISYEYPIHHYTRRLHQWRMAYGGEAWWATRLGGWLLSQPADVASLVREF
jgi:acyl-CoA dehydrogenase